MIISKQKSRLRSQLKSDRASIGEEKLADISETIRIELLSYLGNSNLETVFAFAPLNDEINLMPLFGEIAQKVALPVIGKEPGEMIFRQWNPKAIMAANRFGILEPCSDSETLLPSTKSLILVPALAVDSSGNRLGYGGGYYDRYLKSCDSVSLGCIAQQFYINSLPTNEFDVSIDGYISEAGLYWFNGPHDTI